VFEIIVQKRKEGLSKFFSKGKDEISSFSFKCLSDADMVEWVALLQRTSNELFPSRPPEPLYDSPERIEESLKNSLIRPSNESTNNEVPQLQAKSLDITIGETSISLGDRHREIDRAETFSTL
jgi:hypothetical protein